MKVFNAHSDESKKKNKVYAVVSAILIFRTYGRITFSIYCFYLYLLLTQENAPTGIFFFILTIRLNNHMIIVTNLPKFIINDLTIYFTCLNNKCILSVLEKSAPIAHLDRATAF